MATSGTIQAAIRTGYRIQIAWTVDSQSVANNTSTVTAKVQLVSTGSSYTINSSASKSGSLTINGTKYSFTFTAALSGNQTKTIYTKTVTVSHASDGTKTCSFACSAGINVTLSGTYYGNVTASGSGTFDTIARASTISSVTASVAVNGTNTCTVAISRKSSAFTHTVVWKFGTYSKTTTGVGTSTSYAIPTSWINAMPSATSGTATVTVTTYNGSSKIGSAVSKSFKLTVPSTVVPTISGVTIAEAVAGLAAQFGGYVQSKSKLSVKITAAGVYSSTIKSYKATLDGTNYTAASFTTGTLKTSGNRTLSITVTDSRGRTATTTRTVAVIPYAAPKITTLQASRCLANGTEDYDGTHLKAVINYTVAVVNNKNTASYTLEYKLKTATTWTTLSSGSSTTLFDTIISASGILSGESSYDIRLSVSDYFTTVRAMGDIPTAFTLMDFRANGQAVAFGKVSEKEKGVEFGIPAYFSNGETPEGAVELATGADMDGLTEPGFYLFSSAVRSTLLNMPVSSGSGAVIVLAMGEAGQRMQIAVRCSTATEIWERTYYSSKWQGGWKKIYNGSGKILWSGSYYMTAGQRVDFAEPASQQPSGIALVFCRYADGAAQDYGFVTHYVPKIFISEKGGYGNVYMMTSSASFGIMAAKYLYVHDGYITGNAANNQTGTANGITYNNAAFVLRYVIGV